MSSKLTSRKLWITIAAFLGSIATSIAGLNIGSEVVAGVGIGCGVVSTAIYVASEAAVDAAAAGAVQTINTNSQTVTATSTDEAVMTQVRRSTRTRGLLGQAIDATTVLVHPSERGQLKQVLLKLGWPAEDVAGYVDGEAHPIALTEDGWALRPYQSEAAKAFCQRFRDAHGTVDCAELLRMNAERGGVKLPFCNALIRECVGYVEEILRKEGKLEEE